MQLFKIDRKILTKNLINENKYAKTASIQFFPKFERNISVICS